MRRTAVILPIAGIITMSAALAQDHNQDHARDPHTSHKAAPAEPASKSDATKAFEEANARMHQGMSTLTGDPDVDFMQGMIPHHQGAIDMAEIVLKYGKDPETRKLAEEIIKAQQSEIAMMKAWLAKRGR
jgi:uncharacterized protein (DUF305 family)